LILLRLRKAITKRKALWIFPLKFALQIEFLKKRECSLQLERDCLFAVFNKSVLSKECSFDCGDYDLNDFFKNDAMNYAEQLLGRSYYFECKTSKDVVGLFTVSNASIRVSDLPNNSKRKIGKEIPWAKQGRNYPAVLVGRLGVSLKYKSMGIGSQMLDFIKAWFVSDKNKTGCRFIIVDAYNNPKSCDFYTRNGFSFLFKDELVEKAYNSIDTGKQLKTRLMYFDLITLL
jgi:GNAT superfamily N-acetyltransferase